MWPIASLAHYVYTLCARRYYYWPITNTFRLGYTRMSTDTIRLSPESRLRLRRSPFGPSERNTVVPSLRRRADSSDALAMMCSPPSVRVWRVEIADGQNCQCDRLDALTDQADVAFAVADSFGTQIARYVRVHVLAGVADREQLKTVPARAGEGVEWSITSNSSHSYVLAWIHYHKRVFLVGEVTLQCTFNLYNQQCGVGCRSNACAASSSLNW